MKKSILLLLVVIASNLTMAQNVAEVGPEITRIIDIVNRPGNYNDEHVTIEGVVTQYSPRTAESTANYELRGDYGKTLKVNTYQQKPITNKKYRVTGTIVIDKVNREAYLIEQQRISLETNETIVINKERGSLNPTLIIIIVGAVLLVALIIILIVVNMKKRKPAPVVPPAPSPRPSPRPETRPSSGPGTMPSMNKDDDFQTIKIQLDAAPKTMKLMPGFLEITAGADTGKKFSVAGYPTPKGSIVSIGRENVEGDRKYAHIQLKELTVSRQQAEIIAAGGKLEIKNLSKTNLTQLNGIEIQPGHKMPLEPDSVIKTGEVEFTYREK